MGISLGESASALAVFIQGLLSFFSPCVLPLVPLYIGYLAGGVRKVDEEGRTVYPRGKVMLNTLFFVLGVSFAFFVLGFGFTALGRFFSGNRKIFAQVGGIIVMLFGFYQLGVFGGGGALSQERRLPFRLDKLAMNPLVALLFGFTFSFAWTPCVGPALGSVLLMASSAQSAGTGFALIGVYTLGFILPFLAVGLSAGAILTLFKKHQNIVRWTVKIGGVLLILMGLMMFTGVMNRVTGYLSSASSSSVSEKQPTQGSADTPDSPNAPDTGTTPATEAPAADKPVLPAPDFTLKDQFGNEHTLSDYKGKTVFLNFWATWCGYCKEEMPDLQQLYKDHGENTGDVIILGMAAPDANDVSQKEITDFLSENDYTYPTLMDTTGEQLGLYGISGLPTTFMIDSEGNVFGYVSQMLTRAQMDSIIEQTQSGKSE